MSGTSLDTIIVNILVVVFSVVFHEVAHGYVALRLGDETAKRAGRLTLNPLPHIDPVGSIVVPVLLSFTGSIMFAWAKPVPVNPRNLRHPWNDHPKVAAAGPASNFLLALICSVLLGVTAGVATITGAAHQAVAAGPTPLKFLLSIFQAGILINVILGLFNLIPLPPLDGSWVLTRFLPPNLHVRYEGLRRYGFVMVIGFLLLMRYTALGNGVSVGIMKTIGPFQSIAEGVAHLFGV